MDTWRALAIEARHHGSAQATGLEESAGLALSQWLHFKEKLVLNIGN